MLSLQSKQCEPLDLSNHMCLFTYFVHTIYINKKIKNNAIEEIKRNLTQVDLQKFSQQKHILVLKFGFEKWCPNLIIRINRIKK